MFCPRCHRELDDDASFCPHDGERLEPTRNLEKLRMRPTRQRGTVLGDRYEIRGFIGKGAMARVYLAHDLHRRQPVALKLLDARGARGQRAKERFMRESDAASRIGHPNIVQVLDYGERTDGAPYIVMELLFGEPLGDRIRRDGRITADAGLPIAHQAARGLAAAHGVGIVHRDVKPDNLYLVGETGDPHTVKILDFGLAKLTEQSGLTATGVAVGTLEYMSPEQVVTDRSDERTDVYGLGAVMYRMFTGQLPFALTQDADLLAHQLLSPPQSPRERAAEIDPRLDRVIMKALRKRPDNRYASMRDLVDDLERILGLRDGDLGADMPLARMPDVYRPDSVFARNAARFLYRRLAMDPPSWEG